MVTSEFSSDELHCRFVIRPNRSLSWRESLLFVTAVSLLLGLVSAVFAVRGYWMILPFAGLEVAALAYCTYRVAHAGMRCEVISMDASQVIVEKGRQRCSDSERGGPESRVCFPRSWTRVELRKHGSWYPDKLLLSSSGVDVELGAFLADDEKQQLAGELRRQLATR